MANKKYAIWNKTDDIYTPVGEQLSPADWIARYGWIRNPVAVPVVAAGLINGAYCGELSQMRQLAEQNGAVFEDGLEGEELLDAIAEYEDSLSRIEPGISDATRTADALEDLVVLTELSQNNG